MGVFAEPSKSYSEHVLSGEILKVSTRGAKETLSTALFEQQQKKFFCNVDNDTYWSGVLITRDLRREQSKSNESSK